MARVSFAANHGAYTSCTAMDDGLDDDEYEDHVRNMKPRSPSYHVKNTFVSSPSEQKKDITPVGRCKTDSAVCYAGTPKDGDVSAHASMVGSIGRDDSIGSPSGPGMHYMQTAWNQDFGMMQSGFNHDYGKKNTSRQSFQHLQTDFDSMHPGMRMPSFPNGPGSPMMMGPMPMPYPGPMSPGMQPMWYGGPMMMPPQMGPPMMMMPGMMPGSPVHPMSPYGQPMDDARWRADTCQNAESESASPGSASPKSPSSSKAHGPRTTLMLRNLPEGFSRDMVIDMLAQQGFSDKIDFAYVPMNFRNHATFGYAFVNLVSTEIAEECQATIEGFCSWCVPSQKVCEVSWSDTQGLESHIERYRNSPVMHESVADQFKPALFKDGVRAAFPAPTKVVKPPRTRRLQPQTQAGDAHDQ